jgi:hypothetical protein
VGRPFELGSAERCSRVSSVVVTIARGGLGGGRWVPPLAGGRNVGKHLYLGEVNFERDDDGDEVYRAEFCPEEDVDETLYSRQVWQHHVRETGEPAMIIAQEVHAHAKAATPVAT